MRSGRIRNRKYFLAICIRGHSPITAAKSSTRFSPRETQKNDQRRGTVRSDREEITLGEKTFVNLRNRATLKLSKNLYICTFLKYQDFKPNRMSNFFYIKLLNELQRSCRFRTISQMSRVSSETLVRRNNYFLPIQRVRKTFVN